MKINPGPKGLLPWSEAEQAEGRRLAASLSPVEVYSCLMIERIKQYEATLTQIADGPMGDWRPTARAALPVQPKS